MNRYLDLLAPWPTAMRQYLYRFPGRTDCACYGPGDHGHWALQSNNTAAAAFAVLATAPNGDSASCTMSRDELLHGALGMIRFTLSTHLSGDMDAADGKRWGHSWISALGLERLAHGIDALGDLLPSQDREALARVLVSEADWLLESYPVVAGLVDNNKPESNIWNGCLLHRAAQCVADPARRDAYREKGTRFLLNGISVPRDASSSEQIVGRALSDWHVGANLFDDMGCDHHGYQNIGYMVICLSNIAMLNFSCKAQGWEAPAGLYHHARELWEVVKACTCPDGRLLRIGGDTRVRYCYCQDYAIPVWQWARDFLQDPDAATFESGWQEQVAREVAANGDGRFLSTRLAGLEAVSPSYYVRLEGDRACTLSMGASWQQRYGAEWAAREVEGASEPRSAPVTLWSSAFHGSCLARGAQRMASWTWRAAEAPQGLCLPADGSAMAEWQQNLAGRVLGMGRINTPTCTVGQCETFTGGFATCGHIVVTSKVHVSEGDSDTDIAAIDLACVALSDDRTVVVLQRARALDRPYLREVKGLFLQVGNDVFNGGKRCVAWEGSSHELESVPGVTETLPVTGDWLSIDEGLSVVRGYGPPLAIHRPADRQVCISPNHSPVQTRDAGGNLYVEEICCGCMTHVHARDPNAELFDLGVVLLAGVSAADTAVYARTCPPVPLDMEHPYLRGLRVTDANGIAHAVIANFSDAPCEVDGRSIEPYHVVLFPLD